MGSSKLRRRALLLAIVMLITVIGAGVAMAANEDSYVNISKSTVSYNSRTDSLTSTVYIISGQTDTQFALKIYDASTGECLYLGDAYTKFSGFSMVDKNYRVTADSNKCAWYKSSQLVLSPTDRGSGTPLHLNKGKRYKVTICAWNDTTGDKKETRKSWTFSTPK